MLLVALVFAFVGLLLLVATVTTGDLGFAWALICVAALGLVVWLLDWWNSARPGRRQ